MADDANIHTDTATPAPRELKPGEKLIDGNLYRLNAKGAWVPVESVKAEDLLMDETVRDIMDHAIALSAQIARFKLHTQADVADFLALLDQNYGATAGGAKGNMTLITVDGLSKVQIAVADVLTFGPELQTAKLLVDECINGWAASAGPELRTLATDAFQVDKEGKVSPSRLFQLLRNEIADARWQQAMKAIRDSMRPAGTKEYLRFYRRADHKAQWEQVTIDLASA